MKKVNNHTFRKLNISQEDVLQKSQLKNIIGGYGSDGYNSGEYGSDIGGNSYGYGGYGTTPKLWCSYDSSAGHVTTDCYLEASTALSLCQFWWAAGFDCRCYSC